MRKAIIQYATAWALGKRYLIFLQEPIYQSGTPAATMISFVNRLADDIREDYPDETAQGSVFVFPVDADDYVSNRIATYVNQHPEAYGFKSPKSYRWHKGSKWLERSPYFGGTMNIIRLLQEEFPERMPDITLCFDKETCVQLNKRYPVRWDDISVENKMAQLGRSMSPLPFCSTIYVLGTGANISSADPRMKKRSAKKLHFGVMLKKLSIWKWKYLSQSTRREFGMP